MSAQRSDPKKVQSGYNRTHGPVFRCMSYSPQFYRGNFAAFFLSVSSQRDNIGFNEEPFQKETVHLIHI